MNAVSLRKPNVAYVPSILFDRTPLLFRYKVFVAGQNKHEHRSEEQFLEMLTTKSPNYQIQVKSCVQRIATVANESRESFSSKWFSCRRCGSSSRLIYSKNSASLLTWLLQRVTQLKVAGYFSCITSIYRTIFAGHHRSGKGQISFHLTFPFALFPQVACFGGTLRPQVSPVPWWLSSR